MARKVSILSIAVLLVLAASGPARADSILGVRGGVCVASASLDINQTFDKDNRTGFAGSVFLSNGSGLLAIQPEVSYVQKGVEDAISNGGVELDYLELAALLKAGIPLATLRPHVFGGVGADFEVKHDTELALDTSSMDWNLIFGADLEILFGQLAVVVDGRYALGLTDVSKTSDIVSDLKNRAWIFSAGLGCSF